MSDDPTSQVWQLLEALSAATALVAERTEGHGADPVTMRLLATVSEGGPMRPTELREALGISAAAATRRIRSLAGEGLVTITPDPDDGRAYTVRISRSGRTRLGAFSGEIAASMRARLAQWDDADIETLTRLLRRFVSAAVPGTGPDGRPRAAKPWWREMGPG